MPEINKESVDYQVEQFKAVETGQIKDTAELINSADFRNKTGADAFRVALEAEILKHEPTELQKRSGMKNRYLESFENAFYNELGIKNKAERKAINILNADERESFAQSITAPGAGYTQMGGMQATNINPLLDALFYESSIMGEITFFQDGESKEDVTDITNDRTATKGGENQTGTPADNTTVGDVLDPNNVNFIDVQEKSRLYKMVENSVTAGINSAKQFRSVTEQIEIALIGATGSNTRGTNEFYSILNSKASTGNNKGSTAVTLSTVAGTRPINHVDAVNAALADFTSIFGLDGAEKLSLVCNWPTFMKLARTMDSYGRPYFDGNARNFPTLLGQRQPKIIKNIANDVVGLWDLSKVVAKKVAPIQLQSVFNPESMKWKSFIEVYMDATIRMAYKATPAKNTFRHVTLKADYTV